MGNSYYRPLKRIKRYRPWASTSSRAESWEETRQTMTPRPLPSEFIAMCDQYKETALNLSFFWTSRELHAYITVCLLSRPPLSR